MLIISIVSALNSGNTIVHSRFDRNTYFIIILREVFDLDVFRFGYMSLVCIFHFGQQVKWHIN